MKNKSTVAITRCVSLIIVFGLLLTSVSIVLAQTDLIPNGNFENGLTDWNLAQSGTVLPASSPVHAGNGSVALTTSGGGGDAWLSQCVPWTGNTGGRPWNSASFSAFINADTNVVAARVDVYAHDTSDCSNQISGNLTTGPFVDGSTTDWQPLTTGEPGVDIPNGTVALEIVLYVLDNGGDPATAYFDDVTSNPFSPTAVTLQNLDAQQSAATPSVWLLVITLPLALGAGFLVLRRRRA